VIAMASSSVESAGPDVPMKPVFRSICVRTWPQTLTLTLWGLPFEMSRPLKYVFLFILFAATLLILFWAGQATEKKIRRLRVTTFQSLITRRCTAFPVDCAVVLLLLSPVKRVGWVCYDWVNRFFSIARRICTCILHCQSSSNDYRNAMEMFFGCHWTDSDRFR
jgi:hypothetical protein